MRLAFKSSVCLSLLLLMIAALGGPRASAQSDAQLRKRICDKAQDLGRSIAHARDTGITETQLQNHLDSHWSGRRLRLALLLLHPIYQDPKMSSAEAARFATQTCIADFEQLNVPEPAP
ncbi:MAG TPA: hypothetical protein VEJ86_06950 [Candidatus Binataceae bacterium]|nr:hypothetical protein [Candidatus Binataceae bacterium]